MATAKGAALFARLLTYADVFKVALRVQAVVSHYMGRRGLRCLYNVQVQLLAVRFGGVR